MKVLAPLLFLLVLLGGCNDHDAIVMPQLPDPDPFPDVRDERIVIRSFADAVPVGQRVSFGWNGGGSPTGYAWSLEVPDGSAAVLQSATFANAWFTPDIEGVYRIHVTVQGDRGPEEVSRRVTAASYIGEAACDQCHVGSATSAATTAHSQTVERRGTALFGRSWCLNCHVLNPVYAPPDAVPGSFDDVADQEGLDPDTYVFTDFPTFAGDYPESAARGNVQCEACHGPGSQHDGDPRRIGMTLRAGLCGQCHNGLVGPDREGQWVKSAHGKGPPEAALADASCRRCHTAAAYLAALSGGEAPDEASAAPGVTCAVCHDPHEALHPSQVRTFGSTPLTTGGTHPSGRASSCVLCHQSDIADPAAHADNGGVIPCAVQADMLAAQGAVEYDYPAFRSSFHGRDSFILGNFAPGPGVPDYPDACVTCHMAVALPWQLQGDLGEHTMRMRAGSIELADNNCNLCHPGLVIFDRNLGRDYDGNGVAEGIQTEVRGLLEILYAAIEDADPNHAVARPGGPWTKAELRADLDWSTPALRRALYNYNFVVVDGSFGIHNTKYAVQLLQRTYEQLTGVPFEDSFPDADIA